MTDYEQIRAVFSHLHASPDTITEVLHMALLLWETGLHHIFRKRIINKSNSYGKY